MKFNTVYLQSFYSSATMHLVFLHLRSTVLNHPESDLLHSNIRTRWLIIILISSLSFLAASSVIKWAEQVKLVKFYLYRSHINGKLKRYVSFLWQNIMILSISLPCFCESKELPKGRLLTAPNIFSVNLTHGKQINVRLRCFPFVVFKYNYLEWETFHEGLSRRKQMC